MTIIQINLFLSSITLIGQIAIVLLLVMLILFRDSKIKLFGLIVDKAIPLAFAVALIATLGSLYYSEIAQFNPCKLCWLQRIFIYPQVILLDLAWFKKEKYILDYSLIMIGIGTIIALYHNYIYYSVKSSSVCSIVAPCTQKYIIGLSYVTTPLMSLTALLLIGLLLLNKKCKKYL